MSMKVIIGLALVIIAINCETALIQVDWDGVGNVECLTRDVNRKRDTDYSYVHK